MVKEDIYEKVAFGLSAKWQKSTSNDKIWGQRALGRGKSTNYKGPKAGK